MTDLADAARDELLERLAHFRTTPRTVLDVGGGVTVAAADALRRTLPGARIIATRTADLAAPSDATAAPTARLFAGLRRLLPGAPSPVQRLTATPDRLPLEDGSVDLVLGHWLVPGPAALDTVLAELRRVLATGGLLLWTTPGLGAAAEPLDMHDLGAALARAGFVEPVLDVDRHRAAAGGTAEVIHAAAFAGEPRGAAARGAAAETSIPLHAIGRRRGRG